MFSEPPYTMSVCAEHMPVPSVIKRWNILSSNNQTSKNLLNHQTIKVSKSNKQHQRLNNQDCLVAWSQTDLQKFQDFISLSRLFRALLTVSAENPFKSSFRAIPSALKNADIFEWNTANLLLQTNRNSIRSDNCDIIRPAERVRYMAGRLIGDIPTKEFHH